MTHGKMNGWTSHLIENLSNEFLNEITEADANNPWLVDVVIITFRGLLVAANDMTKMY